MISPAASESPDSPVTIRCSPSTESMDPGTHTQPIMAIGRVPRASRPAGPVDRWVPKQPKLLVQLDRERVLSAYDDGVNAVQAAASAVSGWRSPTSCRDWDAAALAGHLLAIARYYHRLLDAAVQGRPLADLPLGRRLQDMNALDLAALPQQGGPKRVAEFVKTAQQYRERLAGVDWELVLGVWDAVGALKVGQHTGLAVGEWHVHAWDLAQVSGQEHRPNDAEVVAAGRLVLAEPLPAGDPWTATLRWAGREP